MDPRPQSTWKVAALGIFALSVLLCSLWVKNLQDRLNDPTRLPGRWKHRFHRLGQKSRYPLLPWPW